MILISSCLLGRNCKYNGDNNLCPQLAAHYKEEEIVEICPEVMGGLPTPRIPSEIIGGTAKDVLDGKARIINKEGKDVTAFFKKGAEEALAKAKAHSIQKAVLKAKSPSCGKGKVYNGEFCGQLVEGNGLAAELLMQAGIEVITEEEFLKNNERI